ncbi:MAG: TIGR03905 family TSCPD domain-containing protein [Candidatus Gastranaerophilaceae bacterium]
MSETIQYQTSGTCCKLIYLQVEEDKIIDAEFLGGCQGNLQGIKALIKGQKISDIIEKLSGIDCGGKGTSCPDQLAKCLLKYSKQKQSSL